MSGQSELGFIAVHLACYLGNLRILEILHEKFNADWNQRTSHGLSPLHCAAQRKEGIVSIYYLKHHQPDFDPNIVDKFKATPLHYAIMSLEEFNIQIFLSLGSEINLQDDQGNSSLHLALLRYIDDQDNYQTYKAIIKQLLMLGASRTLTNNKELTANGLLMDLQAKIVPPQVKESDADSHQSDQYAKFRFYLGTYKRENAFCCPKHAPLERVPKETKYMNIMIGINLLIFCLSYSIFFYMYLNYKEEYKKLHQHHMRKLYALWFPIITCSSISFIISIILFVFVSRRDPGYTQAIPVNEFYKIIHQALQEDRNLEYFCFFCRTLWSYRGVHC